MQTINEFVEDDTLPSLMDIFDWPMRETIYCTRTKEILFGRLQCMYYVKENIVEQLISKWRLK